MLLGFWVVTEDPLHVRVLRHKIVDLVCGDKDVELILAEMLKNTARYGNGQGFALAYKAGEEYEIHTINPVPEDGSLPREIMADLDSEHGRGICIIKAIANGFFQSGRNDGHVVMSLKIPAGGIRKAIEKAS